MRKQILNELNNVKYSFITTLWFILNYDLLVVFCQIILYLSPPVYIIAESNLESIRDIVRNLPLLKRINFKDTGGFQFLGTLIRYLILTIFFIQSFNRYLRLIERWLKFRRIIRIGIKNNKKAEFYSYTMAACMSIILIFSGYLFSNLMNKYLLWYCVL
jgi:hypothetical protein